MPIKLLYEAQGLIVSIELSTGQLYRGKLLAIEDNMNVQLKDVTITHRDGHVTAADQCFLRGSHIRFFVLPDNLRHAPMFKNFARRDVSRGLGMGKARAEVARVQARKLPATHPPSSLTTSLCCVSSARRKERSGTTATLTSTRHPHHVHLSVHLSTYPSIHPSIHPPIPTYLKTSIHYIHTRAPSTRLIYYMMTMMVRCG